jgi:hypothetical protein
VAFREQIAQYKHSASTSSSLSFPHPSSSDPEEAPNSLDGENGFTSSCLHHESDRPTLSSYFVVFLLLHTMFLAKGLTTGQFLAFVGRLLPCFLLHSALYRATVMIFDEPGLEDLALLMPCFKIEGSGLGCAAFTILQIETVGAAEVEGVGS